MQTASIKSLDIFVSGFFERSPGSRECMIGVSSEYLFYTARWNRLKGVLAWETRATQSIQPGAPDSVEDFYYREPNRRVARPRAVIGGNTIVLCPLSARGWGQETRRQIRHPQLQMLRAPQSTPSPLVALFSHHDSAFGRPRYSPTSRDTITVPAIGRTEARSREARTGAASECPVLYLPSGSVTG
jgi:hypothetical protein